MRHPKQGQTKPHRRIILQTETDIAGWRDHARAMLQANVEPNQLSWSVKNRARSGELDFGEVIHQHGGEKPSGLQPIRIEKAFLQLIKTGLLHSNEDRFDLAYRLLFRAQKIPRLYQNPADGDVKQLNGYVKSIRRDIHKMHAFVRFRKTGMRGEREQFIAWFEPEHHIVEAVGPFFRNRFTGMDWIIATPEASIAWDGKELLTGGGGRKEDFIQQDVVEDEWRTYYRNIFNPARLKTQAMKSEMPVKYWHNLPEAELIPSLIKQSGSEVREMLEKDTAAEKLAGPVFEKRTWEPSSVNELNEKLTLQTNGYGENFSSRPVLGEGSVRSPIMIIGEQPGEEEDRQGRPFVGPAGEILDRALAQADIERRNTYLTNAVKRFKFVKRGKRRIHQTPSLADIKHYRWWLEQEVRLVRPDIIIALGATAARALTGKAVTITRSRGSVLPLTEETHFLITAHPAYVLRIPDTAGQNIEHEKLVRDLQTASAFAVSLHSYAD
ncbi:UdgX family uracil-DNA binding protein [Parasphingorhabdus cellanae]|uniref:Type-4 uracil-DNA glycosylase n=1 Tax=Parasphingorhabdus cellanae TaxID=2806553 RepID=A0ABX7T783_9SPHN|nr:UdgX family uracil-DNA binding protein [Parasphingorhabdus cellanae]QTD55798.1 UdgX family uracil-DNA binding protein [Parasphingorhabdus cellanae]